MYRNYLFFSDLAAKFIVGRIIWLKPDSDVNELKYALTYGYNMAGALMSKKLFFWVSFKSESNSNNPSIFIDIFILPLSSLIFTDISSLKSDSDSFNKFAKRN